MRRKKKPTEQTKPKKKRRRINITREKRRLVYERDELICQLCGTAVIEKSERSLDHLVPVHKGGSDDPENLVLAHKVCNNYRGHFDLPPTATKYAHKLYKNQKKRLKNEETAQ